MTRGEDVLPDGLRQIVERRDDALGTLDATALARAENAPVLVTHVDTDSGAKAFGLARIEGDRAVLSAFTARHDPRGEADIIDALVVAIKSRRLLSEGWLRIERVLRAETSGLPRDVTDEYKRLGFTYFYTEYELQRDVSALPDAPVPAGIAIAPWTPERDADIGEAYNDAFRDRGFTGFDEAGWAGQAFSAQDGFRADLSFLALDRDPSRTGTLAGFCLSEHADGPDMGWIDNVGVRPKYRNRGIASALIVRAMQAMRDAGLARAGLRVNEDNTRARRLYDHLGFRVVKKHVVYRKPIG